MEHISFLPTLDIRTTSDVEYLQTELTVFGTLADAPERVLVRVFEAPEGERLYADLTEAFSELPAHIEIELALLMPKPRDVLGVLSHIRQIRRIYINALGTFAPVERGERDHLYDAMPTFFAYGYETGIALPNMVEQVHDVLERQKQHLYYAYFDVPSVQSVQAVRQESPSLQVSAFVENATNEQIVSLAASGASVLYVPWGEWDISSTAKSMTLPVQDIPDVLIPDFEQNSV